MMPSLCRFSSHDHNNVLNAVCNLILDSVKSDFSAIGEENFEQNLTDNVKRVIILQLCHLYDRDIEPDIDQIIREAWELINLIAIPKRSYKSTFIIQPPDVDYMEKRLQVLRTMPQPEQRTPQWYERRHNLITASNAYLAFGSESSQNRLIYEKCQPINTEKFSRVNTESPMHKGQKYEPVSVMLYEKKYGTKIEDFGCITHESYPFLGASPDGINCDKDSPRYGRMLEIKNISNREINGIPKKEYWIQMQLQMETCKLPECDFLETRFIEYSSQEEFVADGTFTQSQDGKEKGIIVCFVRDERPIYEYAPIGLSYDGYTEWETDVMKNHAGDSWIRNIYWKLDELSCVLVTRNTHWFEAMIPRLQQLWDTVLKERVEGYEHRAPKKRIKHEASVMASASETDELVGISKCLITNSGLVDPEQSNYPETDDYHNN